MQPRDGATDRGDPEGRPVQRGVSGTEYSVQHCLVVSTRQREVVHHRREGDAIVARVVNVGAIELDPPGITIDIAELYPPLRQTVAPP
jgi:hypothetical protein